MKTVSAVKELMSSVRKHGQVTLVISCIIVALVTSILLLVTQRSSEPSETGQSLSSASNSASNIRSGETILEEKDNTSTDAPPTTYSVTVMSSTRSIPPDSPDIEQLKRRLSEFVVIWYSLDATKITVPTDKSLEESGDEIKQQIISLRQSKALELKSIGLVTEAAYAQFQKAAIDFGEPVNTGIVFTGMSRIAQAVTDQMQVWAKNGNPLRLDIWSMPVSFEYTFTQTPLSFTPNDQELSYTEWSYAAGVWTMDYLYAP